MKRSNQVRNHVSDSVEHGIDKLHRVADHVLVYPLAAIEGAIQGAAQGVHNIVHHHHHQHRHRHHHLDQATIEPCNCKYCNKKRPTNSAFTQPVGPYGSYGYPPSAPPPPQPSAPPQFQYHPAFLVPYRPPH